VLNSNGTYTAFPGTQNEFTTDDAGDAGILGGADDPAITLDDFTISLTMQDGRLVGTAEGLIGVQDCPDDSNGCEPSTGEVPPVTVSLPAENFPEGACSALGVCIVTDAHATQQVGEQTETTNYIGTAVLKPGFFAYQLTPGHYDGDVKVIDEREPALLFAGQKYEFGGSSGRLFQFELTPDVLEDTAIGPFASNGSSPSVDPNKPLPSVSTLAFLEKDGGVEDQSQAVWLQTSFYIKTTYNSGQQGEDPSLGLAQQDSFINVALGGVDPETGGLVGERRGGSHVGTPVGEGCGAQCAGSREAYAFTGSIASLGNPEGEHFLGSESPNIVIGIDSTVSRDIGRDIPLDPGRLPVQDTSGATYHVGIGQAETVTPVQTLSGSYSGYATGLVQSEVPAMSFQNVVASTSPDDLTITFDPVANTLNGSITVRDVNQRDGATDAYTLGFGDASRDMQNRSAYIDDKHYAAIDSGVGTSVTQFFDESGAPVTYTHTTASTYLVSGDQLKVTKYFPETFGEGENQPFCEQCDFLQWGAWGTRVEFGNGEGQGFVDNIHLGWWVAGDVIDNSDLPTDASASYAGHVIGNVATNIGNNGWQTYVATGDLDMNWNFNSRSGDLTISRFDQSITPGGLSFAGAMSAPGELATGKNQFSGSLSLATELPANLSDLNGMTGSATGSFVRGPSNFNNGSPISGSTPQGVIGNWHVGSERYSATGIFAGSVRNN
jgi:hypothetical protein